MFQTISILAFVATLIGVIVHWFAFPAGKACSGGLIRVKIRLFSLLLIEQRLSLLGALKKLCYLATAVCFLVLAFTGFWPLLVRGEHISGFPMMIHATFAPIFSICLAILAMTWASRHRFVDGECPPLRRLLRRVTSLPLPPLEGQCDCTAVIQKITFWAIMALSLPLILSIALSMLGVLGTHGQEVAMAAHRWTAVIFTVAAIVHTYLAVRIRFVQ